MSLYFKLTLIIIAILIILVSIMAVVMLHFQKETSMDQFRKSSAALNNAMRTSLGQDMLLEVESARSAGDRGMCSLPNLQ